jgi:hypothetical protein
MFEPTAPSPPLHVIQLEKPVVDLKHKLLLAKESPTLIVRPTILLENISLEEYKIVLTVLSLGN